MEKDKDYWTIVVDSKKQAPSIEISYISSDVEKRVDDLVSAVCKKMLAVQVVFKENARYRVFGGGWHMDVDNFTDAKKARGYFWEVGIEDVKIEKL